jgi:hypothetical protein
LNTSCRNVVSNLGRSNELHGCAAFAGLATIPLTATTTMNLTQQGVTLCETLSRARKVPITKVPHDAG